MTTSVTRWHLGEANRRDDVYVLDIKTISEANDRSHWRRRAERAKSQRLHARLASSAPLAEYRASLAKGYVAGVIITLTRIAPSNGLDDDNLRSAMKAVRDGITDALGLTNDRDPRLEWRYSQERGAKKTYAVRVLICGRA